MASITGLEWQQVDLGRHQAWIWVDQSKTREAIAVPLKEDAVNVLRERWGQHPERVFTHQGKPFHQADGRIWRNAVKAAGLSDFRFHDLRHTWASRHIQAGTPLHALMELGGWSDPAMVRKYAALQCGTLKRICREHHPSRRVRHKSGTAKDGREVSC
jgi:integrase